MQQRSRIVLILAGLLLFGLARPAHAGPVVISLQQLPDELRAGQPFTVGFLVISHGPNDQLAPIAGLSPMVTATLGDERVQTFAEPAATPGHYQATLTLPAPGTWDWRVAAFGEPQGYALTPLQVGAAGATALVEGPTTPATTAAGARAMLRGAGALLLLLAIALPFVWPRREWLRGARSA